MIAGVDLGRGGRPLRIGYGRIFHEACAGSPLRTTREDFERLHHVEGEALAKASSLSGAELESFFPHAELTGFVTAARLAGDVEAVPLSSSLAVPSGPLTLDCFEWLITTLEARVRGAGALDGIYLALHGSMEVEGLDEAPEAVILRRVRAAAGPGIRVAASFDLHGNLSPGIVDPLDILVSYRKNPHWDLAPTGFRAGNQLIRALRGKTSPVSAWRKLPVVLGGGTTLDFLDPMRSIYRLMARMRRDPRVLTTSFFVVHPFTSRDDLGWSVHVTTDGDRALAERLADELAEKAWGARRTPIPEMIGVEAALDDAARSSMRRLGPVTLVDADDIVGAGAPGGSTRIVEALLRDDRGLTSLVPVHDPAATELAWQTPIGETIDLVLAGTPGYDQPALAVRATVAAKADTSMGRRVRLDVGRLRIAVSANPPLPIHPRYWKELGVEVRAADLIVQKNFFHYRIFHLALSFRHLLVETGGATSLRKVASAPRKVPTFPASNPVDWRPADRTYRGLDAPRTPLVDAAAAG